MIGPDGTQTRTIPNGEKPLIHSVSVGSDDVRVYLDGRGLGFHPGRWMKVQATRNFRRPKWEVEIHGGNTNDGDIERYATAVLVYQEAVVIAEQMHDALGESFGDTLKLFFGYEYDALPVVANALPDWLLGIFLADQGEGVIYERGEAGAGMIERMNAEHVGLDRLRELAAEVAERQLRSRPVKA